MPVYKEKNGTYQFRVYIKRRGKAEQIRRRGFKTKSEALHAMLLAKDSNANNEISNLTFQQLYDKYINYYSLKNKGQSLRRIASYFTNHILPYFKDYKVGKITTDDYIEWQKQILSKELSDSFNKGLHGAVVTILNYAIKFCGLKENIAKDVGGFRKMYKCKKKEVWSYDEYHKFISVIDNIVDKALYSTLYETGMRYGELAALKWNDYRDGCLDINKTISKEFGKDNTYILTDPKTKSSNRIITLSDNVIELLLETKEYFQQCIGFNEDWYIFGGIRPYSHTKATVHKNKYCGLTNVKQIDLHSFRHSHASYLLSEDVPITDISERLGHADPSITLGIYSHIIRKKNDPVLDVLNRVNSK